MTTPTTKEWNVLSDDIAKNTEETSEILTSLTLLSRMGMWGEAMFGDVLVLGAGISHVYLSNNEKNIPLIDISNNIDRRLNQLTSLTLLSRMGMWGEAMFGSDDLLGSGTLNYYEG